MMVKFTAEDGNGRLILGMGISEENVKRLKEGMPIKINDKDFFDGVIILFYGKTKEAMANDLKDFIGNKTKIKTPGDGKK